MKLATTIVEMYDFTTSPAEAVRTYEGSGFKYLDYSFYNAVNRPNHPFMGDDWKSQVLEAKEAAEELGFRFVQAHAPSCSLRGEGMDVGLKATIRSIEACGMLGIKNMVIHSGFFPDFKYPDDSLQYFKANEPFMRALIPAMEKNNVSILFENTTIKHCRDGLYFPIKGADLNAFIEFMDHPLFGAAWDIGHANMDGIDHYTEIMTMGKNLKAIHVHDNDGQRDRHTAPFMGNADYDSLIRGLIDSGYEGYFTFESDGFFKYNRRSDGGILAHPPIEVKRAAVSLLHTIGEAMLKAYGAFEKE